MLVASLGAGALPGRRRQLQRPAWQRPARVIPDVPGYQIDRRRLALAGGAAQRRQHAPEWTVSPLQQHLHRMQDCPWRTWTPQLKPALRPVGQALVEVEDGRVQGALHAERARVDLLEGWGKRRLLRPLQEHTFPAAPCAPAAFAAASAMYWPRRVVP
jgi:hypothetical protein